MTTSRCPCSSTPRNTKYAQTKSKPRKPHTKVFVIEGCPWCKPYKQFRNMLKTYGVNVVTCNRTNSNNGGCFRARGFPHVEGKLKRQTLENIIYRYRRNGKGPKNWMK